MKNNKYAILIFFFCLSLLIFWLDQSSRLDSLSYPLRKILAPAQVLSSSLFDLVRSPIRTVSFLRSGEQRIKYLEQRNLELISQVQEVKDLRSENKDLRKQLGAGVSKFHLLEAGKVLGIERYLEFQVNNPTVKVGQSVVYLDNYVGRVVKIGQGIGYVQLVTDPDSKVPAKTDSATGLVFGQFFSDIIFDKVSKSDALTVDDNVLTSGAGGITAPDLVLGRVTKIIPSSDDLFQKAQLTSNIKMFDLKEIYIIVDQ